MNRFFSLLQTASCCKWSKIWLGSGFVGCTPGHCSWSLVVLSVHKWHLIRCWVWNKTLLMTVFAIVKLRMKKTQWNFRGILIDWVPGQGSGYEISTCQMQYDAADKKTDQEDPWLYTLEGTDLDNVESIKYLGVAITSDLRWNTHVSNVCTKANRTLGFLRRNLYSCPQE